MGAPATGKSVGDGRAEPRPGGAPGPGVAMGGALVLASLVLAALNLRPALSSVTVIIDTIQADLGLSRAAAGMLTTIPVVCFGAFGLLTARIAGRLGLERTLLGALALLTIATAARIWSDAVVALFLATTVIGIAIAVGQTLLPGLVKRYFAGHAALATGAYVVGINIGAGLGAIGTLPLEDALGGWPEALAAWAVLGLVATVAIVPLARQDPQRAGRANAAQAPPPDLRLPLRDWRAWGITVIQAVAALIFFCALAWLAPMMVGEGASDAYAGVLLSVFAFVQPPAAIVFSTLANRGHDRRPWVAITLTLAGAGFAIVTLGPMSLALPGTIILGIGSGGVFPLALTLSVDEGRDTVEAGRYAAMALGIGYLIAAAGPVAVGGLRDLTGGYTVPFLLLAGLSVATLAVVTRMPPPAHVTSPAPRPD